MRTIKKRVFKNSFVVLYDYEKRQRAVSADFANCDYPMHAIYLNRSIAKTLSQLDFYETIIALIRVAILKEGNGEEVLILKRKGIFSHVFPSSFLEKQAIKNILQDYKERGVLEEE